MGQLWLYCGFVNKFRESDRCFAQIRLQAPEPARGTPISKLEASLKFRSCRKGRYTPPVQLIRLTETREITPYKSVERSDRTLS
jgi:hypothetical protein